MLVTIGENGYVYEASSDDYGLLPDGWKYEETAGVAVDSNDNVYVYNRSEHPVIVLNRDGKFLRSWGEGLFDVPHGAAIGVDDSIF